MRVLLLLLGLGLAPWAAAEPERLVVGVENVDYLPLGAVQGGEYVGYGRALLDAFAADSGYRIEYRPLPVARLYASFFNGDLDFKFPDNPRWQAAARSGHTVHYSAPVAAYVDGTLRPPTRPESGAAAVATLGTVTGFTPWAWLDAIEAGRVSLRENSSFTALVRQVLAGRVDAAYASVAVVNHQLDEVLGRPGALVLDRSLPHSRDHYHLSTLNRADILVAFDAWLRGHAAQVTELKRRHGIEQGIE